MNDKKPSHWLGFPTPKLSLKHKLIVSTQFKVMQKKIQKLGLTIGSKKFVKFHH
jgi:hypothetical protein